MTRINRVYVRLLEDLIVQFDSAFSDIESSHTKGYLSRDMAVDRIRDSRPAMAKKTEGRSALLFFVGAN